MKASVMPNKNNPKKFDITLRDGTKLHVQRERSRKEGDKFIVTDPSGVYGSFVVTPEGAPSKSNSLTPSQMSALKEISQQLK